MYRVLSGVPGAALGILRGAVLHRIYASGPLHHGQGVQEVHMRVGSTAELYPRPPLYYGGQDESQG